MAPLQELLILKDKFQYTKEHSAAFKTSRPQIIKVVTTGTNSFSPNESEKYNLAGRNTPPHAENNKNTKAGYTTEPLKTDGKTRAEPSQLIKGRQRLKLDRAETPKQDPPHAQNH